MTKKQSMSVAILCMVSFIQAYCLVSVFPYAAYMSVFLWNGNASSDSAVQINNKEDDNTPQQRQQEQLHHHHFFQRKKPHTQNKTIDTEQAGPYAALLTTSFMIGRTCTAHFWGRLADCYGRRFVLLFSLLGSGLASLWFGMSSRYGGLSGAVMARGVLGAWNSIVGVTKTLATELAFFEFDEEVMHPEDISGGNDEPKNSCAEEAETNQEQQNEATRSDSQQQHHQQHHRTETRIVGLVVGMRAWGFLIAPAIAGYLADPMQVRTRGVDDGNIGGIQLLRGILQSYPYLLPNFLGLLLCWMTAAAVFVGIPETLTECRDSKLICLDLWQWLSGQIFCKCKCPTISKNATYRFWESTKEHQPLRRCDAPGDDQIICSQQQQYSITSGTSGTTTTSPLTINKTIDYNSSERYRDNIIVTTGEGRSVSPLRTTSPSNQAINLNDPDNDNKVGQCSFISPNINCTNDSSEEDNPIAREPTSLASIWRMSKYHLLAYWLFSLVVICIDEAFPLYCISQNNGFSGMSESDIGTILSFSGILFAFGQYRFYTWIVDRFGIYGSLSMGCWWGVLPTCLIPLASLFLLHSSAATGDVVVVSQRFSIMYLSLLMGVTKLYQSAFFSSITIATNRTVPKEMRSSMNGFASVGAGAVKALGPLIVGFWMAMCLSANGGDSQVNDHSVSIRALIAFIGIGSLGVATLVLLPLLEHE